MFLKSPFLAKKEGKNKKEDRFMKKLTALMLAAAKQRSL